MTRLSLSPEPTDWQQGRYRLRDDDSDSDSSSDDDYVKVASEDECKYSDDNDDDAQDYPHPVGFSAKAHSAWGSTRFALDPSVTPDLIDEQWQSYNNCSVHREAARQVMQSFPPLESYMDPKTAPTASLLRYDAHQERKLRLREENDRNMDQITQLLEAASIVDTHKLLLAAPSPADTNTPLAMLASTAHNIQQQIQQKTQQDKQRMERDHMEAAKALKLLLKSNQAAAIKILQQEAQQEQEAKEEEEAENERIRLTQEAAAKIATANAEEAAKVIADAADAAAAAEEKIAAAKAKEAAKTEYIEKAKKLVAQLIQLRASIEPFESSKALGKRRLNMKKIVRGKVNTLSESADKIKSVAFEVGKAIAEARAEDEELKKQLQAGNTQIAPEMTRGKRYLVDLLASSIMVRVQAEGFNGLRGDGFPIANMLALVSLENKELIPILSAHIYTVCPTAIPKLPSPSTDASEEALMKSLGMSKDKKGEYETFARFLTRTEGIISLVANIMASNPPNHQLLGGNKGAVEWLSRFLKILPAAPQSPLPLLTAPVLDAFLTGAGHMLANVHPDYFKQLLGKITNDVVDRLDEGPIGQPSAIRLKKTVKDGFDGFKNKIPSKALAELYCGANGTGGHAGSGASFQPSSGVGGGMTSQSAAPDPFGGGGNSSASAVPNPFGGGGAAASAVPNPFGGGGGATTSSSNDPFGKPPMQNPFGGSGASSSNPFGQQPGGIGGGMQESQGAQTSSTFGMSSFGSNSNNNNNPSPFGAVQPSNAPSQFGSSGANTSNPSPFGGGGGGGAGVPAPFGQPAGNPSPFGGPPSQGQPSPFGQPASNPSPFGAGGAGASAPFGQAVNNPSPFGGQPQAGQPSPFGQPAPANNPSPFGGGGGAGAPSPFGQPGNNPSPFGGGMGGTPFGGPQQSAGNPFGGGNQTTPFGGNQQQGGRGGGGRGNGGRGGSKPPCRFFAKGQCRYGNDCRFSHGM